MGSFQSRVTSLSFGHSILEVVGYIELIEQGLTSHYKHIVKIYRSYRDGFLGVSWPNHRCQNTEGSSVLRNRLQSHQVHLTMLQYYHNHFTAIFPGPPWWAGARRELLDFMVQGEINRGRHTDHPAGCHSIRTNQCPPPPFPHIFYGLDALPAAQPTVSKHWTCNIQWYTKYIHKNGTI